MLTNRISALHGQSARAKVQEQREVRPKFTRPFPLLEGGVWGRDYAKVFQSIMNLLATVSESESTVCSLWPVADLGWFLGFHGTPLWAGSTTKKVLMIG